MSIPAARLRRLAGVYDASYPPEVLFGPAVTPVCTALLPVSIVVNTPTVVRVTGTDFRQDSKVWADEAQQITTYVSPTELTYTAEASSAGAQDITVHTAGLVSNSLSLTVTASEEEPVTETTPNPGPEPEPAPEPPPEPEPTPEPPPEQPT